MPYLTWGEYLEFGYAEIEQSEYDILLRRASAVLDNVTNQFYRRNKLEEDNPFRREQFKRALAAQVEYFYEMGSSSSHGLNEPTSVTIGRTTVSTGSNRQSAAPQNELVSPDVIFHLQNTGLLYRGL